MTICPIKGPYFDYMFIEMRKGVDLNYEYLGSLREPPL